MLLFPACRVVLASCQELSGTVQVPLVVYSKGLQSVLSGSGVVDSARRGDSLSFQTLVERYQTPILRYLYRLTGDSELACDSTPRMFVVAQRKLKHLDLNLRFEAWLHRLATQQALSVLRLRRLTCSAPRARYVPVSVEDDRDGQLVQQALLRLPGGMAAALLLWSIGGFSYADIRTGPGHVGAWRP